MLPQRFSENLPRFGPEAEAQEKAGFAAAFCRIQEVIDDLIFVDTKFGRQFGLRHWCILAHPPVVGAFVAFPSRERKKATHG